MKRFACCAVIALALVTGAARADTKAQLTDQHSDDASSSSGTDADGSAVWTTVSLETTSATASTSNGAPSSQVCVTIDSHWVPVPPGQSYTATWIESGCARTAVAATNTAHIRTTIPTTVTKTDGSFAFPQTTGTASSAVTVNITWGPAATGAVDACGISASGGGVSGDSSSVRAEMGLIGAGVPASASGSAISTYQGDVMKVAPTGCFSDFFSVGASA